MKNTRELILKTLAVTRQATINKLSDQLEINPITIRHHLLILEKGNLITSSEKRHGVGRPHLVYQLTNQGQEVVSESYLQLSDKLLSKIEQLYGPDELIAVMETVGKEEAHKHSLTLNAGLQEQMESFCDLLSEQGYQVEWVMKDGRVYIRNASCPYSQLKHAHPEICVLDRAFFSTILAKDLQLESELPYGDPACIYSYEV